RRASSPSRWRRACCAPRPPPSSRWRSASTAGATCRAARPPTCNRLVGWASMPDGMALRLLYVMDPLARVLVDQDTTFAFMLEGQKRGHEQYHCGPQDLFTDGAVPHASVRAAQVQRADVHYTLAEARTVPLGWFEVVFMRKDPPFDLAYYF